jgi:sterol desaturase/sphingolipid hydroxylase (fatty acid hydroxylase superfamily)
VILCKEWPLDFFYFCINHLLISAVILVGNYVATMSQLCRNYVASVFGFAVSDSLRETVQSLPLAVQVVMVLLTADFILYWEHRMFHESPKLWRIHAVHH